MTNGVVGLVIGSEIPPERLRALAVHAEHRGFAELWLSEDCFFTGGITGAALALGATESIPVGIGAVSVVTRRPAVLAMELATLARAFPGRLQPAVGLGLPSWLGQMGLQPRSSLRAVRDCFTAVRELLDGREVTRSESPFVLDHVRLAYPLDTPVDLQLAVAGPRMLRLSGAIADGTVLSVLAGDDYLRWARDQIAEGRDSGDHPPAAHRMTCLALCCVDHDGQRARAAVRSSVAFYLAAGGPNALTDAYGISDDLRTILARGGLPELERTMPQRWADDLAIAGSPEEVAARIETLHAAGADRVALFPVPATNIDKTIQLLGEEVLPRTSSLVPHRY